MKHQHQGKLTIQSGEKNGTQLFWGEVLCEKEYQYYGEAAEALETLTWHDAEEICGQLLTSSHAIWIKSWKLDDEDTWENTQERVLLFFAEEERKVY